MTVSEVLQKVRDPGDEASRNIPKLFLAIGLVFGLAYAFVTPPLRVPDEAAHFFRAYTTARGSCIGTPAILAPVDWREMNVKQIWIELPRDTTPQQMADLMRPPRNLDYGVAGAFAPGNLYDCLPYIPGGVGIAAARLFNDSPLVWMYAGRVSNLLSYLFLIYFAIRLLPAFQLLMATIALMPMALHQAGSLSVDNPAIALSCLFTAYLLRLAFGEPHSLLTRRQLLTLAILVVGLALCKALLCLAVLLLLLPASRFRSRSQRWLWIGGWVALAASTLLGWQWLNRSNVDRVAAIHAAHGILMSANLHYLVSNPFDFMKIVGRTVSFMRYEYLAEFVGKLGWLTIQVPGWVVWSYLGILLTVACTQTRGIRLTWFARILLLASVAANIASYFVFVWVADVTQSQITSQFSAGRGYLSGFQGRYLIPFAFPLLVFFSNNRLRLNPRYIAIPVLAVVLGSNAEALHLIRETYHAVPSPGVSSPVSRWEGKLVRRPGNTPEDGKVYVVLGGRKRWVPDRKWLEGAGYKWPEDVNVISPAELDAIPEAEPIKTGDGR